MQDFVLRGQSFVLTVSSFRAAVKSHADYAKGVSEYKCNFAFWYDKNCQKWQHILYFQVPKLQLLDDNDGWIKTVSLSPNSFYDNLDVHAYKNS